MARISTKDWRNLPIEKWNATTFRAYMADRHLEIYGIDYTANNFAIEGRFIKNMYEKYGQETTRRFIDACFADYKPTPKYPSLNFGFMYSYMRERVLPRVQVEMKKEQQRIERQEQRQQTNIDDLMDWL